MVYTGSLNEKSSLAHLSRRLKWTLLIKMCPLSVVLIIVLVVVVVVVFVNFLHFPLLLQIHWVNFNQTWHKVYWVEGDLSLFKWRAPPFSKGKWLRNSENTVTKFKNHLLPEPVFQFQPNLAQNILGWWVYIFISVKGHASFQGEIITKKRTTGPISSKLGKKHP